MRSRSSSPRMECDPAGVPESPHTESHGNPVSFWFSFCDSLDNVSVCVMIRYKILHTRGSNFPL